MTKSLALTALTIAVLILPAAAAAYDPNLLGLFYDTGATVNELAINPNSQHDLYLVLLNPVNDGFGGGGERDVGFVSGFECGIIPPSGDFLLGVDFPLLAINFGSTDNMLVGFGSALRVGPSRAATLATVHVLSLGDNRDGYRLSLASPPSLAGSMAYLDAEDTDGSLVGMMPVSGAFDRPVFWFGNWHIKEQALWGEVKSLFR
jgi:hypothetical protein